MKTSGQFDSRKARKQQQRWQPLGQWNNSKSPSTSWWLSCAAINNIIKMHQHPAAGAMKGKRG